MTRREVREEKVSYESRTPLGLPRIRRIRFDLVLITQQ